MIVLCESKGFIYIPSSKVANTAILTAIIESTGHPVKTRTGPLVNQDWNKLNYKKLFRSQLFKFAFVRNPWDRLVSCYNSKVARWNGKIEESPHFHVPTNLTFEEFVVWAFGRNKGDRFYNDPHFVPQWINLFVDGRLAVDFIGRFERLEDDWRSISLRFGLVRLRKINANVHQHYASYFTPKLRAMVDEYYMDDIRMFNYEFGV